MVDSRGVELKVGDNVVFCGGSWADRLGNGVVVRFTAKKIDIQVGSSRRYLKFPRQVAKVGA